MSTNLDVSDQKYLRNNVKMPQNLMRDSKKQMNDVKENRHYPVPELVMPVSAE